MRLTRNGQRFAKLIKEIDDKSSLEPLEYVIYELYKRGSKPYSYVEICEDRGLTPTEGVEIIERMERLGLANLDRK